MSLNSRKLPLADYHTCVISSQTDIQRDGGEDGQNPPICVAGHDLHKRICEADFEKQVDVTACVTQVKNGLGFCEVD